jgi:hypothetical protein
LKSQTVKGLARGPAPRWNFWRRCHQVLDLAAIRFRDARASQEACRK